MKNHALRRTALAALLVTAVAACDDDATGVAPTLSADEFSLEFGTLDAGFGASLPQSVTIRNSGGASAQISPALLEGAAASDFSIVDMSGSTLLDAGSSLTVDVVFDPTSGGTRAATLRFPVEGGDDIIVDLVGSGQVNAYAQVDRMGIPALNTVFNHPPQFSKVDYNVATPDNDVADYTGLFETVLGAVANADPSGTAALLLPDALPVSLAGPTSFATLTGRALTDDAVDVALSVTVGVPSLQSDNVDSNDRTFSSSFPYLATPNN